MILVPVTILCWLVVTFLTRPVAAERLEEFYRRVRPGGWWQPVARALPEVPRDGFGWWRFLVWLGGCAGVFGVLFGIGKLLLGEPVAALGLFLLAVAGAVVMGRELLRN
jgi:hypothetical protein